MSTDPIDDPELLSIISSALEMRDEGIEPPIEELCRGRLDLVRSVREAIDLVGDLPSMQERASGRDPHARKVLGGRYRLESRIGSGAMGVVYRAQDLELQRPVAVKILRTDALTAQEAEERFAREAELLAAIRHSAVITIHDRGTTELDEAYLVTELLEGVSLGDLLDEGRRRESAQELEGTAWIAEALNAQPFAESSYLRTVVRWAADLAAGLNAAHEAGVVHRDVKPSNVFIDRAGKPLLLDFGIASSSAHATLMRDSGALGTPAYMAPEALDEKLQANPALDIYGLTATLYHMLVCRAPYEGSPSQVISSLSQAEPPPAYKLRPGLPRDLQAILDKGMARRVTQRYSSALQLESDLRAFLNYRPVSARPVSAAGRVWRRLRRSTAFYAAASVALAGVVLAVGADLKEKRQVRHDAAYMDVWEHVPPGLVVDPDAPKVIADSVERSYIENVLDEALHWRPDSIQARLIRGSFRLDHSDPAGAAEDMSVVASVLGTRYSAELAKRYRDLPGDASKAKDLNLDALPDLESALDHYVAAFHGLRTLRGFADLTEIREHLESPGLEDHAPSLELLIPLYEFMAKLNAERAEIPAQAKLSKSLENYARAERLEEQVGQRTATTALLIGVTLIRTENYEESIEATREGLDLCRHSYGLHLNRGIAARRLFLTGEAKEELERAIEMRPNMLKAATTIVRVYLTDGEIDKARSAMASAPFNSGVRHQKLRLELLGDIEFAEMIQLHREGDSQGATQAAERALEQYEALAALEAKSGRTSGSLHEQGICEAFLSHDLESIFGLVAELTALDPLRWRRIDSLVNWMPNDLDAEQTQQMRNYLIRLQQALSRTVE